MKNLSDKVAIVTGCTGGIGNAVCKSLASNRVKVIGISRNYNKNVDGFLQEYISADLGNFNSISNISTILKKYNHIDYLINCSGSLTPGTLNLLSNTEIESNVNSNLFAVINSIKLILPVMETQMHGQIIIVGSLGGLIPMPYEAIYSSTKFAVRGLCLSLNKELKKYNIDISLISPGPVKTSMLDSEALDENSTISFFNNPIEPSIVANEVINLINKPKPEVILPKTIGRISLFMNSFPKLYEIIFPAVMNIGARKLKKYRLRNLINNPRQNNV